MLKEDSEFITHVFWATANLHFGQKIYREGQASLELGGHGARESVCVCEMECVCVCVRERERVRHLLIYFLTNTLFSKINCD